MKVSSFSDDCELNSLSSVSLALAVETHVHWSKMKDRKGCRFGISLERMAVADMKTLFAVVEDGGSLRLTDRGSLLLQQHDP